MSEETARRIGERGKHMTERTIEKQRALVAVRIMGWRLKEGPYPLWLRLGDSLGIEPIDWHPDTDGEQAMIVAEALRENDYAVQLTMWPRTEYPYNCTVWDKVLIEVAATDRTLELAIFAVAVKVAEQLEGTV